VGTTPEAYRRRRREARRLHLIVRGLAQRLREALQQVRQRHGELPWRIDAHIAFGLRGIDRAMAEPVRIHQFNVTLGSYAKP
jgi:hypothetical protein